MKMLPFISDINLEYEKFGIKMQQNNYALPLINELLINTRPDLIIEFGARTGGLSVFLGMYSYYNNIEFITYEHDSASKPLKYADILNFLKVNIKYEDIFNQEVINFIEHKMENKKTILLCDAGKTSEFNIYSNFMKRGDIILAHDYVYDDADFEEIKKQNIWWHKEVEYKDIKDAILLNNLKEIDRELFKGSAWGVFMKI